MKIAVFGLGYVGLTAVGCLARDGHEVIGIDTNPHKVEELLAGRCPIKEPGLAELIATGVAESRIHASQLADGLLASCDLALVCVGTPSGTDGSHNMTFVGEVTRQIAVACKDRRGTPLTVVYRSTVRPGTMENFVTPILQATLKDIRDKIELVYNPEFLRESVAIFDYDNPPKIVVGTADGAKSDTIERLYAKLNAQRFYTGFKESELTKFVDNTFHALKVSFGNEIGRVCYNLGIDAETVYKIFVSDTKLNISSYYLRPGGAFGGSCLPKDVRALQYLSSDIGANTPVVDSIIRTNEAHKHFVFQSCISGVTPGALVLLTGLAFKPDTDDLRESPNVDLARKLLNAGFRVSVYDPNVRAEHLLGQNLGYAYSQLPELSNLLIARREAETTLYDLVVDTSGNDLGLHTQAKQRFNLREFMHAERRA
ncbi:MULTISPECIES: nucleotide sugar dehydrogenase [Methylobacterium]|uniref:UDP-glucose 6-dehydrogenase n=1 Tax=Methylobacterium thuringiense TaxID=1003091 RepID=A0ABQ4TTC8_9HYPH|nr:MULTISPECIES: nucleotide sugar dehydrogenase [Methylobacterium]TXN20103.1 nucleotide sugar dehydrogenase [Methylobacterium sp. WL9]GJE57912.1 GDP-mannose 6-dehydrogenase [Methylobacterium thuringiense]